MEGQAVGITNVAYIYDAYIYGGSGNGDDGDGYDGYDGDGFGGFGSGSGSGGFGAGFGRGFGYGYGCGSGRCGYGYGYDGELVVPKSAAWRAYHYIKPDGDAFIMRNGVRTAIGSVAHENSISMCHVGLHASLSETDAKKYAPEGSVCTRVLVWGRVIVAEDKLVATYRQLVGVV